jgi:molybdate transport system substrate-binding protein
MTLTSRFTRLSTLLAVGVIALVGSVASASADVTLFAAASTTNVINDIAKAFAESGGGHVTPSFGSSSTLAKQIENGAPAALFLSADEQWMDYLAGKNLIVAGTRADLLGNSLVMIAPKASTLKVDIAPRFPLADLLGGGRLSVGDPAHVPAGLYAKAALDHLGVWDSVKDHLAIGEDVRAALAFVERGEAPLGIVYGTDAAISDKVKIAAVFPEDSHPPVSYPVALIAGKDNAEARAFLTFLEGPKAKAIFTKYGFTVK